MSNIPSLDPAEQKEIEQIATEIVDVEFNQLWSMVESQAKGLSQKELATEFFFQGIMAVLTIQKIEEKEMEEEEARRFQYE